MTQVKFFHNSSLGNLERYINDFLSEQADKIDVKDVKYTLELKNGSSGSYVSTAMIIYEKKD